MSDPVSTPIVAEILKTLTSLLLSRFNRSDVEHVTLKLDAHLAEVANWSENVQFYGMNAGEYTDDKTIPLEFDTTPRRFRGVGTDSPAVGEEMLLSDTRHILLLGDPGSGKTTTVKRLSRRILTQEPSSEHDHWQCPIVVRFRNCKGESSIYELIATAIGLSYEVRREETWETVGGRSVRVDRDRAFFGDEELDTALPKLLDIAEAVLFLDGLDEAPREVRNSLEDSIERLALKLTNTKIIMSCRSGDHLVNFSGFRVLELCPLELDQIEAIAGKWIDEPQNFLSALEVLPFKDLATRPLFLCQLVVLYRNTGYLPEEPWTVYRKIVNLLLEEWDRTRRIRRSSKYAGFMPERKMEFLSALSYQLTYRVKVKRFSRAELVDGYRAIHSQFNLPAHEALNVVQEVETHTGIIVESGHGFFEFSHLSLQEYLCAYYLVREPFAERLKDYLREYPAPVAVAVCLSSNPSNWFGALVLGSRTVPRFPLEAACGFVSRLEQERPQFLRSDTLGLACLKIMFEHGMKMTEDNVSLDFFARDVVRESILDALKYYSLDPIRTDDVSFWVFRDSSPPVGIPFSVPEEGSVPRKLMKIVSEGHDVELLPEKHGRARFRIVVRAGQKGRQLLADFE